MSFFVSSAIKLITILVAVSFSKWMRFNGVFQHTCNFLVVWGKLHLLTVSQDKFCQSSNSSIFHITANGILSITLAIAVMSRSGVLGYHSGSGLLLFVGVALKAQTGSRFSLFLEGEIYRRASGLRMPLAASAPGEATLLMKNPPPPVPPERSARAALLPSLDSSGISEPCKVHTAGGETYW